MTAEARGSILLEECTVVSHQRLPGGQHRMRLAAPGIAARARPGSFVHLRCDPLLPMRRPMSVMRAADGQIEILFKETGTGTRLLARREPAERLSVLGPIGRPFRLDGWPRRALLIGGGVGIPPMVFLAEHLRRHQPHTEVVVLMGSELPFPFRPRPSTVLLPGVPAEVIASDPELDALGVACRLASGSERPGCYHGLVTELAEHWLTSLEPDERGAVAVAACGPTPMLRAVAALAERWQLDCELSLEEHMACAVGGCAGCTVPVRAGDGLAMRRVCVDGPVFDARDVVFA